MSDLGYVGRCISTQKNKIPLAQENFISAFGRVLGLTLVCVPNGNKIAYATGTHILSSILPIIMPVFMG